MSQKLICWDSSVLIEWIKGNAAEPGRVDAIRSVYQDIRLGNHKLAVSTLVYPEVLEVKMSEHSDALDKLVSFLNDREKVEIIAVDIRIAKKAQEIRNRMLSLGRSLSTPDAIHLATAIISKSQVFHTFDGQLVKMNGKGEVDGLSITECTYHGQQISL